MKSSRDIDRCGLFQHGLVTRQQLTDAGVTRQQRRTLTRSGIIVPMGHSVFRTLGTPTSWEQDLQAACLAAGPDALASHRAAAVVWNLIDPPAPVEITVPYEQRPSPVKAIRHRSQALRKVDRAMRRGIPVTTPARTLLDLGAVAPHLVRSALERCLYQGLVTTAGLCGWSPSWEFPDAAGCGRSAGLSNAERSVIFGPKACWSRSSPTSRSPRASGSSISSRW